MSELHYQMIKYLGVGGVVVALNVSVLYVLTEFGHLYYLLSAILAFCLAFLASFFLQKFFTFKNVSTARAGAQLVRYLSLQLTNVCVNTALLYLLVTYLGWWYVFAEIVVSLVLAAATFFISRHLIFREPTNAIV